MKVEMLKPGMPVAIKARGATIDTIRRGERAFPGIVLDVGRYRLQWQGICNAKVALPTPSSPRIDVVVAVPKVNRYHTYGRVEIKPETEWEVDLVQPGQCYSWELFEMAVGDRSMIEMERYALEQRKVAIETKLQNEVRKAVVDLVSAKIITFDGISVSWPDASNAKSPLRARVGFTSPDVTTKDLYGTKLGSWLKEHQPKLVDEHRSIVARLEACRS